MLIKETRSVYMASNSLSQRVYLCIIFFSTKNKIIRVFVFHMKEPDICNNPSVVFFINLSFSMNWVKSAWFVMCSNPFKVDTCSNFKVKRCSTFHWHCLRSGTVLLPLWYFGGHLDFKKVFLSLYVFMCLFSNQFPVCMQRLRDKCTCTCVLNLD